MRLIVRADAAEASQYIAHYIIKRIKDFVPSRERPFVLGLPTGSSPEHVYRILAGEHQAGRISFKNVVTFNMDEYVDLPESHPESYHSFMFRNFFAHVDILPENINILNGNAIDLDAECKTYEAKIASYGGVELFLGGVGTDGHIAFNEAGSSLSSRTRVQRLAAETIRANSRFFGGSSHIVPKKALTVGVGTILDAREVVIIATGAHKAMALHKAIEGGVNHMCTLSALQQHSKALIVVDEEATWELKVKTVKCFSNEEELNSDDDEPPSFRGRCDRCARPRLHITPRKTRPFDSSHQDEGELTPDSMSQRIASGGRTPYTP